MIRHQEAILPPPGKYALFILSRHRGSLHPRGHPVGRNRGFNGGGVPDPVRSDLACAIVRILTLRFGVTRGRQNQRARRQHHDDDRILCYMGRRQRSIRACDEYGQTVACFAPGWKVSMKNRVFTFIALAALTGCASSPPAAIAPSPAASPIPIQRTIIFQWGGYGGLFPYRATQFVTPQPSPEIVLNVSTPWSSGRHSLLSPRPRCPRPIIRLDATGKVASPAIPLDLAGARPTPTLNSQCFKLKEAEKQQPDE